mgnify:CR=1 FL=1
MTKAVVARVVVARVNVILARVFDRNSDGGDAVHQRENSGGAAPPPATGYCRPISRLAAVLLAIKGASSMSPPITAAPDGSVATHCVLLPSLKRIYSTPVLLSTKACCQARPRAACPTLRTVVPPASRPCRSRSAIGPGRPGPVALPAPRLNPTPDHCWRQSGCRYGRRLINVEDGLLDPNAIRESVRPGAHILGVWRSLYSASRARSCRA